MKLFALETDLEALIKRLLSADEELREIVHYHGMRFVLTLAKQCLMTTIFVAIAIGLTFLRAPALPVWVVAGAMWIVFVPFPFLRAYIDWKYDCIVVTSQKIIVIDQSSLFRQKIQQMNLENLASVSAQTQWMNIFPFGILHFDLKEGTGSAINFTFIPFSEQVSRRIADALIQFQNRQSM